jgi:SAM-dependent methyltransferase
MEQAQPLTYPKTIPEDYHWWFATRTRAIETFLRAIPQDRALDILDVGCGAGNMIHHLARYGRVRGIEVDARPVKIAQARGYDVRHGDATQAIPFPDASFDLVTALDVIEHVEADENILREAYRVLKPGGYLLITTPAFQWLWSHNDVLNAHKRRYSAGDLRAKSERAGFRVTRLSYNFFLVFPLAAGMIALKNTTGRSAELKSHHFDDEAYQVDMEPVPPVLNSLLRGVGGVENTLLGAFNLPLGTSLIALGQKPT